MGHSQRAALTPASPPADSVDVEGVATLYAGLSFRRYEGPEGRRAYANCQHGAPSVVLSDVYYHAPLPLDGAGNPTLETVLQRTA